MILDNFFNPKSVAVIGASSDKNKVGYAVLSNLIAGAKRKIYPVSIGEKEIMGLKAYSSVKDISLPIDLAIIAVRADAVPLLAGAMGYAGSENFAGGMGRNRAYLEGLAQEASAEERGGRKAPLGLLGFLVGGDGAVNVLDITRIARIILGLD